VGVHKYFGLYAEVGGSIHGGEPREHTIFGGGGLKGTLNNSSRIVPFIFTGMFYGRDTIGAEVQLSGLDSVGKFGDVNTGVVLFGVFYRTR
jgi:hypothetical protein